MAVNQNSPEFMFGRILARLEEGDRTMGRLENKVDSLSNSVDNLPCEVHRQTIDKVLDWQKNKNGTSNLVVRESIRLKHGIIIGIVSAAAGVIFAWIFTAVL